MLGSARGPSGTDYAVRRSRPGLISPATRSSGGRHDAELGSEKLQQAIDAGRAPAQCAWTGAPPCARRARGRPARGRTMVRRRARCVRRRRPLPPVRDGSVRGPSRRALGGGGGGGIVRVLLAPAGLLTWSPLSHFPG